MILIWETPSGELESIEFDATLRETHSSAATITQHAVESGAAISDHVRPTNVHASFECFVSDSPTQMPLSQMYGVRGSIQAVNLEAGNARELVRGAHRSQEAEYEDRAIRATANVLKFDGEFSRVGRVYEQLERLRKDATILTASTLLDTLENVVITNLSAPQTAADGDGITFTIELEQIRLAETQFVEVPDPVEPRARPPVDDGATTTTVEEPRESLWHQLSGL